MKAPALFCLFLPICAAAGVSYEETQDDFSNEKVYTVKVGTPGRRPSTLFMSCYPGGRLEVQLAAGQTMFPDSAHGDHMLISTTHKFDSETKAVTSNWFMNIMKYDNAWYRGDTKAFIRTAAISKQLNIRLNKRNDIFKFDIGPAGPHLKTVLKNCGA